MRNIFNTFKNHDCMFYLKLFLTYVRPVLEYASQIWSPILKENINRIENVQRYFTRRLLYNDHLSYSDRLELLKIETLEQRRIKSDLTMFFKVYRKLFELNVKDFSYSNRLRGHPVTGTV